MPIKIPFRKAYIPEGLSKSLEHGLKNGNSGRAEDIEQDIVSKYGVRYALGTSSSTAALHLAMCALDLKRGDKVLCPVNSFVDIPEVVRHFDAEPVFVDTLPGTYVIDPDKLAQTASKIKGKKLRAVIVTHPGGRRAPMESIREVADRFDLKIIEDATERMGAEDIGTHSDMSVIGFGSKIDNTIDGGALLGNDEGYYERARLLRNHGMVYTSDEASYMYDVLDIGCQYRMNDFDALYCRALMESNDNVISRRQEIAKIYDARLGKIENIKTPNPQEDHLYTQYIIEIGTNRDAFARKLLDKGIEVSVQYIPLNLTKYYKEKYNLKVFDFPVALDSYQKMMSLPIYPSLSDDEAGYICDAVIEIAKTHK